MTPRPPPMRDVVLVVDDTPDTLGFLTDALEEAGYTALVATGGLAALALVGRITPDIVLLDAMMPGLDGFETCRRLKAGPLGHVPVIFMTALTETEHIVRGLEAGGVDYVPKPIVVDELLARLRVHLGNARSARSAHLALDTAGSTLLSLRRDGSLLWSTPQALLWLGDTYPEAVEGGSLPATLKARLLALASGQPLSEEAGPGDASALDFTYLGTIGADELLFRLRVADTRSEATRLADRFGLTAREAEVLLWVARGKANRDVASILGLSPRTVNKHLETVFVKLGVENRASAAVVATRALGER